MSIDDIRRKLGDSAALKLKVAEELADKIDEIAIKLSDTIGHDGKALFCGNGGSAADSQHLATEMVVRLSSKTNRRALPAIALTVNTSILTACANDYGFDNIFSRQIEALGANGDILFAISTSGNSENVLRAVTTAQKIGILTIGFLGGNGGKIGKIVDYPLIVSSNDPQRIQECHIAIGHIIIEQMEKNLGF